MIQHVHSFVVNAKTAEQEYVADLHPQPEELANTMGLDNPIHIAFLLMLLLLVFGAKRLPEMGRSLGSGMRGFKDSLSGENAQSALTAQQQDPAPAVGGTQAVAPAGVPAAAPLAAAPALVPVVTPEIPAA